MVTASGPDGTVRIENLSYAYSGDRLALDGVGLAVQSGATLALVGSNGSGKSTLLSLLATRLKPQVGNATVMTVAGADVASDPAAVRSRIAVVFQRPSLDVKLTARENLKYEAMLHGLRGSLREQRIVEALESSGLAGRAGDRVESFSGGMRRRLEIAKAMMHRPAVMLLDEPDTGLDVRALDEVWEQLETQRATHGTTLVIATHRMELAERCDAVAVLHTGRKVADGSPDALRALLPGGVLRVEAEVSALEPITSAVAGMRDAWSEASRPRIVRGEVVAYADDPASLAAELQRAFGDRLHRVAYGRSTMHDVFLALTGEDPAG
ncbi:MAG: ABC transporter ATP-binding protein [Planctomycetota bacterium]